jgi:hypothetical protein
MGSPREVMLACEPAPIAPPSIELDFQEPGQREQYAIQRIQFALGEYLCWAATLNLYIAIEGRQCLPCVSPIIAAGAVISGAYLKPGEAMHGLMKIDRARSHVSGQDAQREGEPDLKAQRS